MEAVNALVHLSERICPLFGVTADCLFQLLQTGDDAERKNVKLALEKMCKLNLRGKGNEYWGMSCQRT